MNIPVISVLYDLFNKWRQVEIIPISPLQDIEKEPIYKELVEKGYEIGWPRKTRIREKRKEGWEIVLEKSMFRKNKIFMDRNEELQLMFRKKTNPT